jgi:rhomboid protease GluP
LKKKLVKTLLSERPSAQSVLLGMISLAFLVFIYSLNHQYFTANGIMVFEENQYWRAFTTSLIHADANHLGHNVLFFTGLAILLNHYFGWLIFPLVSFLIGGFINLIALKIYPPEVHLVGISGVIYFMAGFWLTLYLLIERRLTLVRRSINIIALSLIFLFPEAFSARISYLAHGLGFLFGLIFGTLYFLMRRNYIRSQEVWVEPEPDPVFEVDLNQYALDENDQV